MPFKFTTSTVTPPFPVGAQKPYTRAGLSVFLAVGWSRSPPPRGVVTSDGRNLDPTSLPTNARGKKNNHHNAQAMVDGPTFPVSC